MLHGSKPAQAIRPSFSQHFHCAESAAQDEAASGSASWLSSLEKKCNTTLKSPSTPQHTLPQIVHGSRRTAAVLWQCTKGDSQLKKNFTFENNFQLPKFSMCYTTTFRLFASTVVRELMHTWADVDRKFLSKSFCNETTKGPRWFRCHHYIGHHYLQRNNARAKVVSLQRHDCPTIR